MPKSAAPGSPNRGERRCDSCTQDSNEERSRLRNIHSRAIAREREYRETTEKMNYLAEQLKPSVENADRAAELAKNAYRVAKERITILREALEAAIAGEEAAKKAYEKAKAEAERCSETYEAAKRCVAKCRRYQEEHDWYADSENLAQAEIMEKLE
ncbi:hypothetical protein IL306_010384 [Fusarium sp. DS 682]|nr:hypothetical protein IL306_010384 [Fusarium sp. DS 682]